MNKNLFAIVAVAVIIVVAVLAFTLVNRAPDAGVGATEQDNVAAGVPAAEQNQRPNGETEPTPQGTN